MLRDKTRHALLVFIYLVRIIMLVLTLFNNFSYVFSTFSIENSAVTNSQFHDVFIK